LIEVKNLTLHQRGEALLDGVSFKWKNGLIYGVLGDAESGKDCLLRAMAGVVSPDGGQIKINGFDLEREPMQAKACIGFLPKDAPLPAELTVAEHLHFVAEARGISFERAVRLVNRALESVGLEEYRNALCASLSGYRASCLGLAQTLVGKQDILLLEEPTAGLDPARVSAFRALLSEIGEGRTLILSTSSVEEIRKLCDHVLLLSGGRVELDLPVEEIGSELGARFRAGRTEEERSRRLRRHETVLERDGEYELIDTDDEKEGRA
jgi:ABC-2 type transport system ATP-binding protein